MNDQLTRRLTTLIMAQGMAALAQSASTNSVPAIGNETNAPSQLPNVVVKGQRDSYKPEGVASPKFTEPLRDIPQTITVIPKSVMDEQGATSLRDVMRNVPGISMQAGEGGVPNGDNLSIRGFNARTDIFVDSVRDFGGYSRDPFNLEQVEVIKGPGSSHSGRGSTGGSINLVTKSPMLQALYGGSLGFGTDEYKRATLDVNQPVPEIGIKGTAVRLNGLWHDADVPGRDVATNQRWGLAPSVSFGLGTKTRVTFGYFHMSQDNVPDYGLPWVPTNSHPFLRAYGDAAPPVDFNNFYGLKSRDYEKVRTDLGTARVEHDFNDSLTLRNLTRFGQTTRDSIVTSPRFVNPNTSTMIRRNDWKSRDQVNEILANQTDLTSRFDTGKIEHTVVTSLEFAHEDEVNHTRLATGPNSPATDLFSPNSNDPYTEAIQRNGARTEAESDSMAISLFDTVKLSDKWQLNGGLRWDYFDATFKSVATNGNTVAGTPLSRVDKMFSYRFGLTFKPLPNGSIYAAYGTSFNPSAEGLSLSTNATAAANFQIDPEESRTFEIGTKWDLLEKRLALSLALFRTEKINARTEDPANPGDTLVLDGQQHVDGVEIGAAGSITEQWKVFAGYSFLHSEIDDSKNKDEVGNRLSNTPQHSFSLWTTYQLPWNLEVGAGAQFVGMRFNSNSSLNRRSAPQYWLGDAMLAYHPTKNLSFRLNVSNLTDERYIDSMSGGHFIPGAGRAAFLTASFRF